MKFSAAYDVFRYHLIPPSFLLVFTGLPQLLVFSGNPENAIPAWNLGSPFAWKVVSVVFIWAYLSLIVDGETFEGPKSPEGQVPQYKANGVEFYFMSIGAFATLITYGPHGSELCRWIYDDFGAIINALSISALVLCFVLYLKGRSDPSSKGKPAFYLYYRGTQLHPRLLGVDVKQWTNCRVGMLAWALLTIVFAIVATEKNHGGNAFNGSVVHAFLVNAYLAKFFYWETGYFNTLDITLDRAGCVEANVKQSLIYRLRALLQILSLLGLSLLGAIALRLHRFSPRGASEWTNRRRKRRPPHRRLDNDDS